MLWFKKKKCSKGATEQFYKYLKIEQTDGRTDITADITDEDIKKWLYGVAQMIQTVFKRQEAIKNYLTGQLWLGGQQIEFALVKDFKEGPHAMRMKLEEENKQLKDEIKHLTTALT
jgi:hypothetical protein